MARNTNMYSAHWVGSAGFATSKMLGGQTIVSQKSLGPTNEKTDIQIGNERSMATLVQAGRKFKAAIYPGFNELKVKNTPTKCRNTAWGAYIGENRKYENEVFDYTIPELPVFDPANFIAAKGTIEKTELTTATGDVSAQTVSFTWPDTSTGPGQSEFDKLWTFLYNETTDLWSLGMPLLVARSGGSLVGVSATDYAFSFIITDVVRVYAFFQGYDEDWGAGPVASNGKESDSDTMIVTLSA